MLPSPSSSPPHPLRTTTNLPLREVTRQLSLKSFLCTPPSEKKPKRQAVFDGIASNKRIKLALTEDLSDSDASNSDDEYESSDDDDGFTMRVDTPARRLQQATGLSHRPGNYMNSAKFRPSSEPILRSFVSSNKADTFKCVSANAESYLTPPYACAYSNRSKHAGASFLAVADEQGTVSIFNTTKRQDWDDAPGTKQLHSHRNGVFQVKWNEDDDSIASCSGDQSIRITNIETSTITHVLRGQSSTIKCISYDPSHRQILASGSRDGTICLWDLRASEQRDGDDLHVVRPCQVIPGAHQPPSKPKSGRKPKNVSPPPGITSLLHPEGQTHGLISCATADGILKHWDLRYISSPTPAKSKGKGKGKQPVAISSELDPTDLHNSRRPRGLLSLAAGKGPTAGLIFALGADSRIHTYSLPALQPYTNASFSVDVKSTSFYVTLSVSPCGRWLASGGTEGTASLFDIAKSPFSSPETSVKLKGQDGEIGAVDWSGDSLATCADDGTVRVWRRDVDVYRQCLEDPEESRWNWSWSS